MRDKCSRPGGETVEHSEPDPRLDSIEQRLAALGHDYLDARFQILEGRLAGMDRASELFADTVGKVPTDVQTAVGNLKELHEQRFGALDTALNVALMTAKEAVKAQDDANQKAIAKAEENTNDRIDKQEQLFRSEHAALVAIVSDIKDRATKAESSSEGAADAANRGRLNIGTVVSIITLACSVVLAVVAVAVLLAH
jgi:hypothetical protein